MNDDQSKDVVEAMEHFQMRAEKTIALEDLLATSNDIFKKVDINDLQALESRSRKYIDIAQARYVLVNPNWTLLVENFQTLQVTDHH